MKYLVCRKDAIRPGNQISSSCFPIVVELFESDYQTYMSPSEFYELVCMKAFEQFREGYIGKHEYVVIPMANAYTVSFKPKAVYDVTVSPYV